MVLLPLWVLLAYLTLCNADNDSESDESGERKLHKRKHGHSEFLPSYTPHGRSPPIYPSLPSPGGFVPHTHNHPAYHVPNVQPVYGWYAPPPVGYSYNFPGYGGQQPQGYFGIPHGMVGYGQIPPPYYGQQPYGFPTTGGYSPNMGGLPPSPGGTYPPTSGGYSNAISQQPLPGNNGLPHQQPPTAVGQQPALGGYYPPPPSSSSSSSSSTSTINQQPFPANFEPTNPHPSPRPGQPSVSGGDYPYPNSLQRPGDYIYLLPDNNSGSGQNQRFGGNNVKPCDNCL